MSARPHSSWVDRWGAPLLSLVVLGGVAGLVVLARRAAAASPRFLVDPGAVSVLRHPPWLPPELAQALARDVAARLGVPASLLGDRDLQRWAGDLPDQSAWICAVEEVRAQFPGRAEVTLRLRRPVLALPGEQLMAADGEHLGRGVVDSDPRPLRLVGLAEALEARECAAAAGDLLPHRAELARLGILVDRVSAAGGRVVFLTDTGVELEWGRSGTGSEFAAVDLPPATRVAHLLDVFVRYPGLRGVQRIVLWKDRPEIVVSP